MAQVLIAHDSEQIREVIRTLVVGAGHRAETVSDGRQAVDALARNPDVLVLDVAVGDVLAYAVVDETRKRAPKCKIVLVASVYNRTGYKRRPTSLYGADDYVEQHHIPDSLIAKIAALVGEAPPTNIPPPHVETKEGQVIKAASEAQMKEPSEPRASDVARERMIERAERMARLIVGDVALYNGESLEATMSSAADLSARFRNDLEEARLLFDLRIPAEIRKERDFIGEALDELMKRGAGIDARGGSSQAKQEGKLTVEQFRLLRDLIVERYGIQFEDDARYLVERRLRPRLESLNLQDFGEYHRFLSRAPEGARAAEFEEIAERITTNETYFFRESYQLDALRREILPEVARRKPRGKRLAVWSAGCSSGEEPYTLAMLLLDAGLFAGWDLKVVGTDVSRKVLHKARDAVYGRSSFRTTDSDTIRRHFVDVDKDKQRLKEEPRQLVTFQHANLLDEGANATLGEFDVVLCRNVIIYLAPWARQKLIDNLTRRLVPGGYLLLGHSESLVQISTSLQLVHLKHDMVYRKPSDASP